MHLSKENNGAMISHSAQKKKPQDRLNKQDCFKHYKLPLATIAIYCCAHWSKLQWHLRF